jgi:hypothetical protein
MGLTPGKNGTKPLHFTPGQFRDTVGLSVETFRHWKRVLSPFSDRRGRAPRFSIGDLLAASILRRLTDHCGVRVGHLAQIAPEIVGLCNSVSWAALEDRALIIDLANGACRLAKHRGDVGAVEIAFLCSLNPIMLELRDALRRSHPTADQRSLFLPPVEVESETRGRRRAT